MIRNTVTKQTYPDRQQAKKAMGHAAFNKAVKNGEIEYIVTTHDTTDVII